MLCESKTGSDCLDAKQNFPPEIQIKGKDTPEFLARRREMDIHNELRDLYKMYSPMTFAGLDQRGIYNKIAELTLAGCGGEPGYSLDLQEKFLIAEKLRLQDAAAAKKLKGEL